MWFWWHDAEALQLGFDVWHDAEALQLGFDVWWGVIRLGH